MWLGHEERGWTTRGVAGCVGVAVGVAGHKGCGWTTGVWLGCVWQWAWLDHKGMAGLWVWAWLGHEGRGWTTRGVAGYVGVAVGVVGPQGALPGCVWVWAWLGHEGHGRVCGCGSWPWLGHQGHGSGCG